MRPEKQNCKTCVQIKKKEPATGRLVENSQALTVLTDVCGPFREDTFG